MNRLAPYSKAAWAAIIGFIAPGATLLLADAIAGSVTSHDLLIAGLTCVVGATAGGAVVYAAPKNKLAAPAVRRDRRIQGGR